MRIESTSSGNAGRKWKKKKFQILYFNWTNDLRSSDSKCVVLARRVQEDICLDDIKPKVLKCMHLHHTVLIKKRLKKGSILYTQNTCTRNLNEAEHTNWYEPRKKTLQNYICKPGRRHSHTVSRRAPSRSPKVISTIVAFGSESWSIITLGVGTVSVSLELPSC